MVNFLKPNKAMIVLQEIKKYPSKIIRKDSAKKTGNKSRVKPRTRRWPLVRPPRSGFKTGKNRWFFTKLRF
ncbi:hypothetical protein like AT3G22230 [Hibiscus trionum]|uniref:Uncharacterized protein n=1 Tax=Hibiscus trionum TaxID=183268 RepID=A0A9W7GYJ8_HIBTR|nr:hypothetical protein like AT3G22230 [Hibiscus trionum]